MKQSSYRHYGLKQATRKSLTVSKFGGVDFSTSKFLVDSSRAIDASNFIYKNHTVQKRNGFEELFKVAAIEYVNEQTNTKAQNPNGTNFNGIWRFQAEDGNYHTIAHIGFLLFEISIDGVNTTITPISNGTETISSVTYPKCYQYEDFKSSAFVGNKMLWFFGGNRFMVIRYPANNNQKAIITPVDEWEYTYVPTTTISITAKNTSGANRASLDNVNLMTKWRKNKCITANEENGSNYIYELDSPIIFENPSSSAELSEMTGTLLERSE